MENDSDAFSITADKSVFIEPDIIMKEKKKKKDQKKIRLFSLSKTCFLDSVLCCMYHLSRFIHRFKISWS